LQGKNAYISILLPSPLLLKAIVAYEQAMNSKH